MTVFIIGGAKTWEEVKETLCDNWDSCSPCMYAHGYNRHGGGFTKEYESKWTP